MLRVHYQEKLDSHHLQYVLSLGLEAISDIIKAESYKDRYQLLESKGCPSRIFSFLCEGLWEVNRWRRGQRPTEDPVPVESAHVLRSLPRELDAGPKQGWFWAHNDPDERRLIYARTRHHDRQWGYVLWDKSRIDAVGLTESASTSPDHSTDRYIAVEQDHQQRARMQDSWIEREKVWSSGGRGWWSFEDESRVEWARGQDPR